VPLDRLEETVAVNINGVLAKVKWIEPQSNRDV